MSPTADSTSDDLRQANADLQRQLAERTAERDEAIAQQAAVTEVLQVINSSPGDLRPVFDAMLEKAHTLCGATQGGLILFDGERLTAAATRGYPKEYDDLVRRGAPPQWVGSFERLRRGERHVHILDLTKLTSTSPLWHPAVEVAGIRTMLSVPLRRDGAVLGYISAQRQEVRQFSDQEIALLQNFAAQAVIAMENARLIGDLRERTAELEKSLEYQTATSDVLQVISRSTFELQPVLDTLVKNAAQLCAADFGHMSIREGDAYRIVATFSLNAEFEDFVRGRLVTPGPASVTSRTALKGEVIHLVDPLSDPTYATTEAAVLAGVKTILGVPLLRDGAVAGTMTLGRARLEPFNERQIELIRTFADQAVIAIENARLLAETREALEHQTATAEVLGVINSSPGALTPVFEAILEKAHMLCDAPLGALVLYDGENLRGAATRGYPSEYARLVQEGGPATLVPAFEQLLRGERAVHVPDAATHPLSMSTPIARAAVEIAGIRTLLLVPLRKDGNLLGYISAQRQEVKPFSEKQIALLQNFAAQAVIAMENARLLTETRDALEQQTAAAEVLGVINSSPGNLTPVFDAMLEKATTLCNAAFGVLWSVEKGGTRAVASHNVPDAYRAFLDSQSSSPGPNSGVARTIRERSLLHFDDAASGEAYRSGDPFAVAAVELGGVRTLINAPLIKDDIVLGILAVYRKEVRPFSDKQIALLKNFAAQAVIAVENARLLTETREALEQQTATAEVLQVINASPGNLSPVFDAMLEKATRLCGAPFGQLAIYDGQAFRFVAAHGETQFASNLQREPHPPSDGVTWLRILDGENVVHVPDAMDTDLYRTGHLRTREFVDNGGGRSLLSVALRKDDVLLGVLSVYRQEPQRFADKQIALLQNFAVQAVIAMENARLITETREALEQQTATAEVLGVINSSPGDLTPVFDAMLERAMRLCSATVGMMWSFEGNSARLGASRNVPKAFSEYLDRNPPSTGPETFFGRAIAARSVIHIADMRAAEPYLQGVPLARAGVELAGIRALMMAPLVKDGAVPGVFAVFRSEPRPFTDKQIALLENFAAQAVIAMENARLLGELRQRTEEVAELNRGLEARVAEQVEELGRVGRLKRFLAPQLAELIVSQGDEKILESHRREIVVVFCDLRGYTAFTETAEPEEVLGFLREYHGALGPLVSQFEGTLDQFSGDGIMVFFNDPVPIPDPAERAVRMGMAMREAAGALIVDWRERGRDLGFGAGIAQGFATLGQIGFSDRSGYTAIGTVCNIAARLCAEAKDNQILLSQRVNAALKGSVATEQVGALALKGLTQPVVAYNVPLTAGQTTLRVIEGGPPHN